MTILFVYTLIDFLLAIGFWPSKLSEESLIYIICNSVLMTMIIFFALTITFGLYDIASDIILIGENLCILTGLYMIILKIFLYRIYKTDIKKIANEFQSLSDKFAKESEAIRKIQKEFYIRDVLIYSSFVFVAVFFIAALVFQPFVSSERRVLPFRSKHPFSIEDTRVYVLVYVFQAFCTLTVIKIINYTENIGCLIMIQTGSNLKLICEKIRELGRRKMSNEELGEIVADHQRIIRLVDYINDTFYYNFLMQMCASTFMICMSAFAGQLAKDQPMQVAKFRIYMIIAFMQLLYYSWAGNQVKFNSMEIAEAIFECNWLAQSPAFRRDLTFIILRSQTPLSFRAPPLFAFDFEAFTKILNFSYTFFTMLRTMSD